MNKFDELFFSKYVTEESELLFVCHRHVTLIIDRIFLILFFGLFLPSFFYFNDSFTLRELVPFSYFEGYLAAVYLYLLYSVFDWYNDVWLLTDQGIVDLDWNVFAGNVTYVSYHSIHGVEIKRDSIFDSLLGKGDISIHLQDETEEFELREAANPDEIAEYVQGAVADLKSHSGGHEESDEVPDDREPFQVLLDTLTEMVKDHLAKKGPVESPEERKMAEEILKQAKRRTSTIDLSS
ncbi:MAG: PH domain-containing protein [Patescibacteria group bacterium]